MTGWRSYLGPAAAVAGVACAALAVAWVVSLWNALRRRRGYLIVPTPRSFRLATPQFGLAGRTISQVRLRRRNSLMKPAGGARFTLETTNGTFALIHTMSGPPWMAGVLDMNHYPGLMAAPLDKLDINRIGITSIRPPLPPMPALPAVRAQGVSPAPPAPPGGVGEAGPPAPPLAGRDRALKGKRPRPGGGRP